MKKWVWMFIAFFSFIGVTKASEVEFSFNENFKENYVIKSSKNENIKLTIYYKAEDFDVYGMLTDLDYDHDHLELIDYKEEDDFTITIGKRLLADRYGKQYGEKGKIVTLNFKVKDSKKSNITLKNITTASLKQEISANDVSVLIDSKAVTQNTIYYIMITFLVASAVVFIIFKKNSNNNSKGVKK